MTVALAVRSLLEAPVAVAAVAGAVLALGLAALCFGYQGGAPGGRAGTDRPVTPSGTGRGRPAALFRFQSQRLEITDQFAVLSPG